MISTGITTAPSLPAWATLAAAAVTVLFGGGGLAAWMKIRADRKAGVEAREQEATALFLGQWESLARSQVELLLDPLRREQEHARAEVLALRTELDNVKDEMQSLRHRYWSAITLVRSLYTWIAREVPDEFAHTAPQPPDPLAHDI